MLGANVKAETMKLIEQRTGIETEMSSIIELLSRPGGPGITGNLTDFEGFPRADIDIPAVRADRHRLAELRNDHVAITEKISQNIQVLHSAKTAPTGAKHTSEASASAPGSSMNNDSSVSSTSVKDESSTMDVDLTISRPFAVVDEITEASPAAEDGLQLGDQVVKFGNVEYGEDLLQRLSAEAQKNQGHAVPMAVLRQGVLINLAVTPRAWEGRGLMGYTTYLFPAVLTAFSFHPEILVLISFTCHCSKFNGRLHLPHFGFCPNYNYHPFTNVLKSRKPLRIWLTKLPVLLLSYHQQ